MYIIDVPKGENSESVGQKNNWRNSGQKFSKVDKNVKSKKYSEP